MTTDHPVDVLGAEEDSDDGSGEGARDELEKKYGYTYGEFLVIFGWLGSIAMLGVYMWSVISGYSYLQTHPPVSVDVTSYSSLNFPKTTFCSSIPDTALSFTGCTIPGGSCTETLSSSKITVTQAGTVYTYQCFTFNGDGKSKYKSNQSGYGGSIAFEFTLDDFSKINSLKRAGLYVFFNTYDEGVSVDNDHAKFNFASVGDDNFFTLSLENIKRLKTSVEYRTDNTLYKAVKSSVKLINYSDGTVVVSVGYGKLDITTRNEFESKTWTELMGEIAGMLGVLFGLDLLKMIRVGFIIFEAVKTKQHRLVYEALN